MHQHVPDSIHAPPEHRRRKAGAENLPLTPPVVERLALEAFEGDEESHLPDTQVDAPQAPAAAPSLEDIPPGTHIGPFRIVERLGAGGMGLVYLAEQETPVQRQVALKVLGQAVHHPQGRLRFAAETQAMARLSHPNVAALHEAGTTPTGHPWLAMEWIDGRPITTYCDTHRLGLEERIRLFITVCRGVQHAHFRGILHRDLKPSNVLVRQIDGEPSGDHAVAGAEAKIIDFGIAKSLDDSLAGVTLLTGDLLGTPAYLSPEAAALAGELDTRTDVYSLGVLLHELLLGVRPYDLVNGSVSERLRRLRDKDPEKPSTGWTSLESSKQQRLLARRGCDAATLRRTLHRDLDWILLRALARDRSERYPSAQALAEDLRRFLEDEPVEAGPPTGFYLLRKAARRHRGVVVGGCLLLVSLVAGFVARSIEARKAVEARAIAEEALVESESTTRFLYELFGDRPAQRSADRTIREVLRHRSERVRSVEFGDPVEHARILRLLADTHTRAGLLSEGEMLARQSVALLCTALGNTTERANRPRRASISRQLADSLLISGRALLHLDRLAEASQALHEGIALLDHGSETNTELKASALHLLGIIAERRGDPSEAVARWRQSLAVNRKSFGPPRPLRIVTLEALARALEQQGEVEAAKTLLAEAVDLGSLWAGPRHPRTLRSVLHLAEAEFRLGHAAEAGERAEFVLNALAAITSPAARHDHRRLAEHARRLKERTQNMQPDT